MAGEMRFPSMEDENEWGLGASDALSLSTILDFDIPFASFPKTDRLVRIADWTTPTGELHGGHGSRRSYPASSRITQKSPAEEDETGWSFASEAKVVRDKKFTGPAPTKGALLGTRDGYTRGGSGGGMAQSRGPRGARRGGGWGSRYSDRQMQRKREPSVAVSSEWKIVEEIEFSRLAKLQLDPGEAIPIKTVGRAIKVYDRSNDKISTRQEKLVSAPPTEPIRSITPSVEEDRLLLTLAAEHGATAIIPDVVASVLMAAPRTVLPWDIAIKRRGDLVLFDKRPESDLDLLPVNETATEIGNDERPDSINSPVALTREMARLLHFIPTAISRSGLTVELDSDDRIPQKSVDGSALRYAKLDLGESSVVLVRSRIPMVVSTDSAESVPAPLHLATLLEYEHKGTSGMDWRLRLDTQRGAVFAHEIRNNSALLARNVFQALLSGVEHVKIAYLSRVSPKDPSRHALLGLHDFEPYELAAQMNLNVPAGFGILRAIVDLCRGLPSGTDYVLMRDPNKPTLRLYKLPGGNGTTAIDDTIDELIPATAKVHISEPSDLSSDEE